MLLKTLTQKPFIVLGMLFLIIFIFDLRRRGFLERENLKPSSCRAVIVKLKKRVPLDWKLSCEEPNMAVEILINDSPKKTSLTKVKLYRELANSLITMARHSPTETLERVPWVRMRLNSKFYEINAVVEGKNLSKFSTMRSPKIIREHLKTSVQVQERRKGNP